MKTDFPTAMEAYKKIQGTIHGNAVREFAAKRLIEAGAEEIGSSDINHSVYALFQEYNGDLGAAARDYVENHQETAHAA